MDNVCIQWDEQEQGRHGDGITRAETKRHAIRYAQARWPGAAVEVA